MSRFRMLSRVGVWRGVVRQARMGESRLFCYGLARSVTVGQFGQREFWSGSRVGAVHCWVRQGKFRQARLCESCNGLSEWAW